MYYSSFLKNFNFFTLQMALLKDSKKLAKTLKDKINKQTPHDIVRYALSTEKAARNMEQHNTLVFYVDSKANKPQIRKAVAELYGKKVVKVNTLNCRKGKKAYVKFADEGVAIEIASQIGLI